MPSKRGFRKTRFRAGMSKRQAVKKLATKQYVKKLVRKEAETKYNDNLFSASVDTTGTLIDVFDPAQGVADTDRVGDKVTLRGMRMSFKMAAADTSNYVRIVLFQWYPNSNLSVPTIGTVLFDVSTGDRAMTSPYVHDYQNQFHVIYDKVFTLAINSDTIIRTRTFKPNFKYVKKTVEFTAGTVNASNKLYVFAISDSGAISHPTVFMYTRVFYDDS